jgi:hypothetical protein
MTESVEEPCQHVWVSEYPLIADGFTSCGWCGAKGPFQCPYAPPDRSRCPQWRCDCFIDLYPDSPFALHPEAFVVTGMPTIEVETERP